MPNSISLLFKQGLRGLAVVLLAVPALAFAQPPHAYRLANGMKVLVIEDHRAPTVVHLLMVGAGSLDEVNGTTGVAHVLEHMMFKGTKKVGPGEYSHRIAALGGRENAYTTRDYTAYHAQIEQSRLPQVMALEADRLANLQLATAEFDREIKVVREERRLRTDDQPHSLLWEQFWAAAFVASPAGRPVVGWMDDLQQMRAADARDWYRSWYAPNNAVLIVCGDVDARQVEALAQRYYGGIAARPLPQRKPQQEPEQRGVRRIVVKAPAENPSLLMGWKVPVLRSVDGADSDDAYALAVLSAVLDGYDNARLTRKLVRDARIADELNTGYDFTGRPSQTLFVIDATPAAGHTVADVEAAVRRELAAIARDGVDAAELARVKAQLVAGEIYKRDSLFGQVMEVASVVSAGLPAASLDAIVEKLKAVTPQQVQAVAAKYFGDDTLTVATLSPLPIDPQHPPQRGNAAAPLH